jgi:hypothetical protein
MFCHFQLPGFSSSPISKAQNPSAALTSLLVEKDPLQIIAEVRCWAQKKLLADLPNSQMLDSDY